MVGELRASQVIHLHRLLSAVRAEFQEDGLGEDRLEQYREHDVAPAEFKATKTEHERALMTLSAALSEWAREQRAGVSADAGPERASTEGVAGSVPTQSEPEVEAEPEPEPEPGSAPEAGATR